MKQKITNNIYKINTACFENLPHLEHKCLVACKEKKRFRLPCNEKQDVKDRSGEISFSKKVIIYNKQQHY